MDLILEKLSSVQNKKNLLAFSAGVDSTALFFLLKDAQIDFDIAIVDYSKRDNSKLESDYAKKLAFKYNKKCFTKKVILTDSNFEKNARNKRYEFFENIISEYLYDNLITAHQLNDRLEWFLMQFTKGAGVVELLGFKDLEIRDGYKLIRPLIKTSKSELLNYLLKNDIKYFEDKSNFDLKFTRNQFRHNFSNQLIDHYEVGILKSFEYLQEDGQRIFNLEILIQINDLYVLKNNGDETQNIRAIDKIIKKLGFYISKKQRDEIIRQKDIVVAHKISVCITDEKIFIAPYINTNLSKEFKEKVRILKIPAKIRGYLFTMQISELQSFLDNF